MESNRANENVEARSEDLHAVEEQVDGGNSVEQEETTRRLQNLRERARRGNRAAYEAALAQVPDVEPDEQDRL